MSVQSESSRRSDSGFGTVEVLVATAVGLLIVAGFIAFNHFQLHALQDQVTQIEIQTADRNIIDLFAREVRRAGADPTCAKNATAILEASATNIRIQADLNGNGTVDNTNSEDVTYRYNSATNALERLANGTTEVLISFAGVDGSGTGIRYFDSSLNEIVGTPFLTETQRSSVRRVRLELALATAPRNFDGRAPLGAVAATDVDIRNRFFIASTACP